MLECCEKISFAGVIIADYERDRTQCNGCVAVSAEVADRDFLEHPEYPVQCLLRNNPRVEGTTTTLRATLRQARAALFAGEGALDGGYDVVAGETVLDKECVAGAAFGVAVAHVDELQRGGTRLRERHRYHAAQSAVR